MGLFDEFIVNNYICSNCGEMMHFRCQTKDYERGLQEFYIGDYIDKANKSYYYYDCYPISCEHCNALHDDIVFAVRNGQFVDVLSRKEADSKSIELYENIEDGYERKKIYDSYCEKMIGSEDILNRNISERLIDKKPGDSVTLLKHKWTIIERYKIVFAVDDCFKNVSRWSAVYGGDNRYLYRISDGENKRLLSFLYDKYGVYARVKIIKDEIQLEGKHTDDYSKLVLSKNEELIPIDYDRFYCKFLSVFIRSDSYRDYLKQVEYKFNDWDMAAMIYNLSPSYIYRYLYLKELMELTADNELTIQINERLKYDEKAFSLFAEDGGYFFAAVSYYEKGDEPEVCGYYGTFAEAEYQLRSKLEIMNSDKYIEIKNIFEIAYEIEKYQIVNTDMPVICPRVIASELVEPDRSKAIHELDYDGDPIAAVRYNLQGSIIDFWSYETPAKEALEVEYSTPKRFEYHFVPFPDPFDMGDKVRIIGTWKKGIIATSKHDWSKLCDDASKGKYTDWTDAAFTVQYDNGEHEHICSALLEKCD